MSPDNAPHLPPPDGEALAEEVRRLRALLEDLQTELNPAVQSSLRERSSELQRMGGELHQLQADLAEAQARSGELEREVERWRGAATRGVDEIAQRARDQAERFEAQTAEVGQALAALRAQLETSRGRAEAAAAARDEAAVALERSRRRNAALKSRVLRGEARRRQMTRTWVWRMGAPFRWLPQATRRLLLGGARLRRRLLRR
jgi:chromosome segregation ATPase